MNSRNALAIVAIILLGSMLPASAADPQPLPWEREISLREAAAATVVQGTLNATDPGRSAMSINNLKMHTVMWGPPNRITISINKNNVWDRRLHEFHAPTLQEMTEGAFSPANKDYVGVKEIDSTTFATVDIVGLASLADKLANKPDPLSASLSGRLDDKAQASLAAFEAAKTDHQRELALLADLAASFNTIIAGPSLAEEKAFQNITLRPGTDQLRRSNPQGRERARLNRLLLEDAYPEISKRPGNSLRPFDLGWLRKEGGTYDPYRYPMRYAFPCLKPVGQIILGIDPLAGGTASGVTQSCANGVTSLRVSTGDAEARLQYVLGMDKDIYAIRGDLAGISTPVWLRLYRHRDTSHQDYMTADGKSYTRPEAEADKAFNGPIDPPTSGTEGRYFWIRQKMPAEKTFPQGFEYVLMGVVAGAGEVKLESVEGKTGLGTPPPESPMPWDWFGRPRPAVAAAPGAAATATFTPDAKGKLEAFVTIVTTIDGPDLIGLAKKRLAEAEADGFEGLVRANTRWWNAFYDLRENGRVFHGLAGPQCSDNIRGIYQQSWTDSHGGGTKTDMRQLECSASYALPERDIQDFDGAPCYNEIFPTSRYVHNWGDSQDMWKQIVQHWLPGAKQNARDRFNMPGMLITHGYLPPITPDKYVHTTVALELCLGTMAEILRPGWDEWDYGGDINYLRRECYPLMREMALFYAAYAKKGGDGYYHIMPCMEEERWGIYPRFARNKDVVSSLCLFRWGLTKAADAAELLGVDADLRKQWREVAAGIAPYPIWKRPEGLVFAVMPGVEPRRLPRDHQEEVATYPATLADEINLDSPQEQKDIMLRTVRTFPSDSTSKSTILLGLPQDRAGNRRRGGDDAETLLNSRSGRIHLFPAVADSTAVAFRNFQARGGFLVSAARKADGVYYVEVQARRDLPCQLMNPWPGKTVVIHEVGKTESVPVRIDKSNGECLVFATVAGQKYLVEPSGKYHFDGTISRPVLENFLARSISVEGVFNGRGDLDESIRMLKSLGVKYAGRSLCLWGAENNFLANIERAKKQAPKALAADPEIVLEACVFETVGPRVEQIAVPDWVFTAFGQPVEKRNFIYNNIIYPVGQRRAMGRSQVPDESRPETQMWFYYQAVSYIDAGFEGIHFGQVEIMNRNDRGNAQWDKLLTMVRAYAAKHARRHMVLCNGHTPSGGLVHDGKLLLDFHAFPLRVKENPDKPGDGILQLGFSDGIYNRSKGGVTFSGWKCAHLPYLVELDNYGNSRTPGRAGAGTLYIWGYDEISWFAHQSKQYRADWLKYAWDWVRKTDPNGFLQMPGSRTATTPDSRWYYANNPSPACPTGLGDEDAIRAVWAADAAK